LGIEVDDVCCAAIAACRVRSINDEFLPSNSHSVKMMNQLLEIGNHLETLVDSIFMGSHYARSSHELSTP